MPAGWLWNLNRIPVLGAGDDPFHHVRDFPYFELPQGLRIPLPEVAGVQLTKFMVLQVVAGLLVLLIFRGLAKRLQSGEPATGRWWNFWETLAVFIRDEVVRPTIGTGHHDHDEGGHEYVEHADGGAGEAYSEHVGDFAAIEPGDLEHRHHAAVPEAGHPADKYAPFVWSCFFYVLFCNLLGAVPWLGSPTGEINVTGALAAVTLVVVILVGSQVSGPVGFWLSLAPGMDLHPVGKLLLVPMIWVIELVGFLIKHGVLAIRLFANIMAGHTVIAVILGFIAVVAHSGLFYVVAPASVLGQVAIGLLELFVAFLQAYIFAFLTSLFLGAAVHPH